ncbi:MAG: acyl-CoA dehydrogenase family protein [Myxococcales bacterium]|nr:acyl-CoA dehydrogenase [Sorangiineae bacterium PRO1]MCL4751962.1 acyl-CoA dehydrogenase family protein [Myxococcales bacterium]
MTDSEELGRFRAEVQGWIARNRPAVPGFKLPQTFLEVENADQLAYHRDWQAKVYDAGYLGFDVPEEYGGRGIQPERKSIVEQELSRARAPFFVNFLALTWVAPTLLTFGTEAQKSKLLRPLLRGDEIWCQGFSEPNAGSDLASLTSRAVKTATGWEVTGHKVWTTLAHFAKWMILLARTNPDVNKYAGLSYFLFPMDAPGVTVQPLLKMTREGGFNQVLFERAPMPSDCLLGEEGQGWNIALTTLMFERGAAESSSRERASALLEQLKRLVALAQRTQRSGRPVSLDPVFRERIAQLWIEASAMGLSGLRSGVSDLTSERPLALPLMNKLAASEWNQRLAELACEMLGPDAMLGVDDPRAPDRGEWPRAFMNSFGMTIGGGTSEILRNIIGERVLGLPKSK